MKTKTKKQMMKSVVDALDLDEVPIAHDDAKAIIEKLGIDESELKSMATTLRAKCSQTSQKIIDDARVAYAQEIERLESRKSTRRSRAAEVAHFEALLGRAKARAPAGVAMHFLKYESASDEELSELIRSLEHLLGDDE